MSAALKLAGGFALAALLLVFVEALLAAFPNPLWMALLLLPVVAVAVLALDAARRRRAWARPASAALGPSARSHERPAAAGSEPDSPKESAIAAAVAQFNASQFPRTVAGITKALGTPEASVVPLPEAPGAVALTIAWELSWYRYRVDAAGQAPVALDARGEELSELEDRFTTWNASVAPDGRVALELERSASPG